MKIMIKGQMFHQSNILAVVLTRQILYVFSVVQIFTKVRFSKVYIFTNMSTLNVLFEKMIMFSPLRGRLGVGHIFRTDGDR